MLQELALGAAALGLSGLAWRNFLRPLPAVWRGDVRKLPRPFKFRPQVRTYLPWCLWVGAAFSMIAVTGALLLINALTGWRPPGATRWVPIGLLWFGGAAVLLHIVAWAFNWPKFVIHPAWREWSRRGGKSRAGRGRARAR